MGLPAIVAEIAQEKRVEPSAIEVWFADEARIGQKKKITRHWARGGTRPAAPTDQRTASTYIFGAICSALGKGAALILPRCNTVDEPASGRDCPGHRARCSCCASRGSGRMASVTSAMVPPNISCHCRRRGPELNPVENIWQYMRDNWLSNRIFLSPRTSSITVAMPETSSSHSRGRSCQSASETGHGF